jgi:aspartate/glutamate racemase
MIACTELSLIADAVDPRAQVFDTLDVLVTEIATFSLL